MMSPVQLLEVKGRHPQNWVLFTDDELSNLVRQIRHLSNTTEVMYLCLNHLLLHVAEDKAARTIIESAIAQYMHYTDQYNVYEKA